MQSNIQHYYPNFYTFYEGHFFPGQTPVPLRSGTCIPDLSHDPIWAIWLAEVRKFHQHHDRISNYIRYKIRGEIIYPFLNFYGATVEVKEWISNFIPDSSGHIITYACWGYLKSIHVIKGGHMRFILLEMLMKSGVSCFGKWKCNGNRILRLNVFDVSIVHCFRLDTWIMPHLNGFM